VSSTGRIVATYSMVHSRSICIVLSGDGKEDGTFEGIKEGAFEGECDGTRVGTSVGRWVGSLTELFEGIWLGAAVGIEEGFFVWPDDELLRRKDGKEVGTKDGPDVGREEGLADGLLEVEKIFTVHGIWWGSKVTFWVNRWYSWSCSR
jgi:hypothetical protein